MYPFQTAVAAVLATTVLGAGVAVAQTPLKETLLNGPNSSGANFGNVVAIDGVLAAVGAPGTNQVRIVSLAKGYATAAIVNAPKPPDLSAALRADGLPPTTRVIVANFGSRFAFAGGTLVTVASNRPDTGGIDAPGLPDTVQVFRRAPNQSYVLVSQFVEPFPFTGAIALVGNLIAAGAITADGPRPFTGAVGLLDYRGKVIAKIAPSDLPSSGQFGAAISASASSQGVNAINLVIGAPQALFDVAGRVQGGAAYVFDVTGGRVTQVSKLTPQAGSTNDLFGQSVAADAGRVLVGSSRSGGTGYVYRRINTATPLEQVLRPQVATPLTLGVSVALSDVRAIVASRPFNIVNGQEVTFPALFSDYVETAAGAPFTLRSVFSEQSASNGQGGDFGIAVALQGNQLVAGGGLANGGFGEAVVFTTP